MTNTLVTLLVLTQQHTSTHQAFSICTSVLTTAFTSTTIAFDSDTSPTRRLYSPAFYGYVPDGHKARLKVFLLIFLIKIAHVTSTSMGMAFLFTISPSSAYVYLATNTGVYMLYRACRGDLYYWMPLEGKTGWFSSILIRLTVKVIVDFTGCIQFRNPKELGGLYYSLTLLQAQVGSAVCAKLYIDASEGDTEALSAETVYAFAATVSATWACSYALFFAHIEKGYAGTFTDTRSAFQYVVDEFNDSKASDEQKAGVVTNTRRYWRSIEDEARKFLAEKWAAWEQEKPKWFDKAWIAKLHDDMLPERVLAERRRGGRRRSSIAEMLIGAREEEEEKEDESDVHVAP